MVTLKDISPLIFDINLTGEKKDYMRDSVLKQLQYSLSFNTVLKIFISNHKYL